MIKIIISFFILIYIESKETEGLKVIPENIPKINFGKDNYYNKNRNQFIIPISANNGDLLFYITTDVKNCQLNWEVHTLATMYFTSDLIPPGEAQILNYIYDGYAYINITGKGKEEGIIWVNPLNKEINIIEYFEKYGKMIPIIEGIKEEEEDPDESDKKERPPIKYVVSDLIEDVNVTFKYLKEYNVYGAYTIKNISNPFKVCQGFEENNCKDKVEEYTFKKNETYTIYVQFEIIKTKVWGEDANFNVLTEYSFYDKNMLNNSKTLKFSLISLILLLMI